MGKPPSVSNVLKRAMNNQVRRHPHQGLAIHYLAKVPVRQCKYPPNASSHFDELMRVACTVGGVGGRDNIEEPYEHLSGNLQLYAWQSSKAKRLFGPTLHQLVNDLRRTIGKREEVD